MGNGVASDGLADLLTRLYELQVAAIASMSFFPNRTARPPTKPVAHFRNLDDATGGVCCQLPSNDEIFAARSAGRVVLGARAPTRWIRVRPRKLPETAFATLGSDPRPVSD